MKLLSALLFTLGSASLYTHGQPPLSGPKPEKSATFRAVNTHAINIGDNHYYLTTSETSGLTLRSEDNQVVQHHSGRYSLSDIITFRDQVLVSTINTNTSDVHIILFSEDQAPETLAVLPPGDADTEAVCLSDEQDYPELFVVNARGSISQYALPVVSSVMSEPVLLRTLSAAPGIKSCSVAENVNTLYLADEYAGIWAYPTDIESDERRSLVYHHPQNAVEGVSALPDGTVFWVSPDQPAVFSLTGDAITRYPLDDGSEPEAVHVIATTSKTLLSIYDDAAEEVSVYTIPAADPVMQNPDISSVDFTVSADAETTPVARFGDAADDPAIWYNAKAPRQSLILGTDKKAGLNMYSLDGSLVQSLAVGRVNNVDVRYDNGHYFDNADIAVASNRSDNSLSIFSVTHDDGKVREVTRIATGLSDVYGLCLYQAKNTIDVFVNDTDGRYQRHRLIPENGSISSSLIEEFALPSQPEGCVADDARQRLYMGEESAGIWHKDLSRPNAEPVRVTDISGPVKADIEGMALFDIDGIRYLLVSSQGNHRYALYTTDTTPVLVATFTIGINWDKGIDGVSETDGLDASNLNFGEPFPEGMIVVQDGHNVMPSDNQNFKIIDASKLTRHIRAILHQP
ncbi:phytase [Alteromonas antoniana]|uniref:phytase n=1 Tax=Alteromonas antoniana TaxID=2803813 RepID=UPI001C49364B|nr:phytase [Alteromonas antoniana]